MKRKREIYYGPNVVHSFRADLKDPFELYGLHFSLSEAEDHKTFHEHAISVNISNFSDPRLRDNNDCKLLAEPDRCNPMPEYSKMDKEQAYAFFCKVTEQGESFSAYLRKERISQSTILLKTTRYSIKQIAEMTGFGSVHYFTRTFTVVMNSSPGQFRQSVDGI